MPSVVATYKFTNRPLAVPPQAADGPFPCSTYVVDNTDYRVRRIHFPASPDPTGISGYTVDVVALNRTTPVTLCPEAGPCATPQSAAAAPSPAITIPAALSPYDGGSVSGRVRLAAEQYPDGVYALLPADGSGVPYSVEVCTVAPRECSDFFQPMLVSVAFWCGELWRI